MFTDLSPDHITLPFVCYVTKSYFSCDICTCTMMDLLSSAACNVHIMPEVVQPVLNELTDGASTTC